MLGIITVYSLQVVWILIQMMLSFDLSFFFYYWIEKFEHMGATRVLDIEQIERRLF